MELQGQFQEQDIFQVVVEEEELLKDLKQVEEVLGQVVVEMAVPLILMDQLTLVVVAVEVKTLLVEMVDQV